MYRWVPKSAKKAVTQSKWEDWNKHKGKDITGSGLEI